MLNVPNLEESKTHGTPLLPLAIYIETVDNKNIAVPLHWHRGFELVYIEKGTATFTINLANYIVNTGDIVIVPPNALHAFTSITGYTCSCRTIIFDLSSLESVSLDSVTTNYIIPIQNNDVSFMEHLNSKTSCFNALLDIHNRIFSLMTHKPKNHELKIKACLFDMLVVLYDTNTIQLTKKSNDANTNVEIVRTILDYIRHNRNKKLDISTLASIVGFSNDHFIRFFKKYLHQTPIHYIRHYRLDYARIQLENSDKNITEIAYDSGFNDVSYFIKLFKERYDISPRRYRNHL